ncbi:unnamed protein product [Vitrella brassicaformis CCMP3155]|uniref:Uncharacterized protein n=1 Tax=Vitrella brassicaformis (strain CCMP3155) TaxID=1169540 RepID=A0A0G4GVF7_VITBC|nr:unnamed protein product [Vitrella brassicaformis CCMP3155]|mmetsp:Transcript_10272/g.29678  ORF Transcript_10272/g.29678 Transcript_10272/m.29678 type:complete len:80 (-) Transcript_10272:252-491(-)|eukprot:CEM34872.1 unnamed protein product [Vitrella brassicaformis CCMP3155]
MSITPLQVVPIFNLGFVYAMRVRPGPDEAVLMQPDWQYQLSRAGKVAKYNVGEWLKHAVVGGDGQEDDHARVLPHHGAR